MIDLLKASWDHLPKKPRLPPSLFSLKTRKAWLSVKPEFTYNDERDKVQRDNARRAKRQLARDEAWALHEKKKAQREKERAKRRAEREAKQAELKKAKALKAASRSPTTTTPPKPKVRIPTRAATAPSRPRSPVQAQHPRVVYTVPVPKAGLAGKPPTATHSVHRSRTVPQPRPSHNTSRSPSTRRPVVRPWGPISGATQRSPVTRSHTYPPPASRRRP